MTTPNEQPPTRKPMCHRPPLGMDTSSAFYFITVCAADRSNAPFIPHATEILESARYRHNAGLWFLSLFLIMPDHIHMLVHVPTVRSAPTNDTHPPVGPDGHGGPPTNDTHPPVGPDGHGGPPTNDTHPPVGPDGHGGPPTNDTHPPVGPDGHGGPSTLAKTIGDFKSYISKTCGITFQKNFFDTRIRDAAHYAEKWNYILRNPVARGLVATPREWPHVIAFNRETGEELPHK